MSDELMPIGTQAVTEAPIEVNEADFSPEADQARMAKLHQQLKADSGAVEEEPEIEAAPAGDEERGPDGKFKPKSDKPTVAKSKDKAAAEDLTPSALKEARRLIESEDPADIDRACHLAFGKGVADLRFKTRQWEEFRRKFVASEAKGAEKIAAADARQAEVRESAKNLLPLAYAKHALDTGDAVGFLKHLGTNPDDFQRRLITQMTGQGAPAKDPEVQARLDRIEQRERELAEAEKQRAAKDAQLREQQAQHAQREIIAKQLSESTDPRFQRAAGKPKFVQRVHEIQCDNFIPPRGGEKFGSTITELEAAELAWDEIYGGVVDATPGRQGRPKPVATETRQGRANPAERGRLSATTSIRTAQAAETAPDDDDSELDYTNDDARRAHEERLKRRLHTFEQSNA